MTSVTTYFDIQMPQMGESITEATIIKWHKRVGETVKADETLLEISTAKVEAEIPAPQDGVIAELLFPEEATVPVDTVIARLAPVGTQIGQIEEHAAEEKKKAEVPAMSEHAQAKSREAHRKLQDESLGRETPATAPKEEPAPTNGKNAVDREREKLLRRRSTPLVRNICKELGISVEEVPGTGPHGRVTKPDVMAFLEEQNRVQSAKTTLGGPRPAAQAAPAAPPPPAQEAPQRPATVSKGSAVPAAGQRIVWAEGMEDYSVPMSNMRKAIAAHMVESRRTSPHAYTVFEIDMTNVMRLRASVKTEFEARYGVNLTPLAFIMKAVAESLVHFPIMNSSIENDHIVYHRHVNIGVAVALEEGLIVPVMKNMEEKSMIGIARSLAEISTRARQKRLTPKDVEGGTFTVTSPGQKGALFGLPIIAQPQVAIMHVGAVHKRPSVVEGPDGSDMIAIRSRVVLSLGIDHRAIDGWVADSFMAHVKERLESCDFRVLE